MRRLPSYITLLLLLSAAGLHAQMTAEECLACHSDPSLTKEVDGKSVSVHVDESKFTASVHSFLGCTDCHTQITDYPHQAEGVHPDCASCHPDAVEAYATSIHAHAIEKNGGGAATCAACHGDIHAVLPASDPGSRVSHQNIPDTCGSCHGVKFVMEPSGFSVQPFFNYMESVHGRAVAGGSESAAVCTDCHDSHAIVSGGAADSPIFKFNVPQTCGKCHDATTREFNESVHGKAIARGNWQSPVCTDCHGIHLIKSHIDPTSTVSSQQIALTTCASCHEGVKLSQEFGIAGGKVKSYRDTYHGLATRFGSNVAANCASCHGVHNILPSSDPQSTIHKANLADTCGTCHPGATEGFVTGRVHLDIPASEDIGSIATFWIRWFYLILIYGLIGVMLLHNLIIWGRKAAAKRKEPGRNVIRMSRRQRVQHLLLLISFVILVITGFALAFPESWIAWILGNNETFRSWTHRVAGVVMLLVGVYHVWYMLGTSEGRKGLRDFLPDMKDVRDAAGTMGYYLGLSKKHPQFRRFTYGEKMEYWALVWGTILMGVTGLMMWFNVEVSRYMARWWIDIATAIHFYEAILATLAIVVWHFYQVIFDPDVYPMNWAWWDGRMSEEQYAHEHPIAYAEWRAERSAEVEPEPGLEEPEQGDQSQS